MSRFDTIKKEIDGTPDEPELLKENDLTERRFKLEGDFKKVKTYLAKTIREMAAILNLISRSIQVDIGSSYKLNINNDIVTISSGTTYNFDDVIKSDFPYRRDIVFKIMESMPQIRKEFEAHFDVHCARVAAFLKTLPESFKKE